MSSNSKESGSTTYRERVLGVWPGRKQEGRDFQTEEQAQGRRKWEEKPGRAGGEGATEGGQGYLQGHKS